MDDPRNDDQPKGTTDAVSHAYVAGGVPFLILFFIVLFSGWVGACDASNVMIYF